MLRKGQLILFLVLTIVLLVTGCGGTEDNAGKTDKIRFAVGPFLPSATDTKTAYRPFIEYVSEQLGVDYELKVTNDWAGISVALSTGQVDVAWMGPWGYVLAHHESGAEAIATVKYDGEPTYRAIIVANPDLTIENFPEDAEGLSISFADA